MDPRDGKLSDLEAKLLAAAVGQKLFNKKPEPVELGRYRLLERLGQGGMGVVFRAHDAQLRRDVALKLLHAARGGSGREQHARLRREALALGRLSHPNVVQVYEVGEEGEHVYVVMELVRGTTLRGWLDTRRSVSEVVAMGLQIGRGLAAAHAAGVVHRDLKPENVLVGADGRARVVDFGLARALEGVAGEVPAGTMEQPLTRTGTLLGTPAFMAPEQLRDPTRADARSDQFSYCVLMYEALYGERPFIDRTATEAGTIRAAPIDTPVPAALRAVIVRGLSQEPGDRWPSMEALLTAIEASPRRTGKGVLAWIGGAVALVVIGGAVVVADQADVRARALAQELVALKTEVAARAAEAPRPEPAPVALPGPLLAIPLRFTGPGAGPWTELEPSVVRGDPTGRGLAIDGFTGAASVAWALESTAERVVVELDVAPRCMAAGTRFTLGLTRGGTAEIGLGVVGATRADATLQLHCGEAVPVAVGRLRADASHPPITVQVDVDAAGSTLACRVRDESARAIVEARTGVRGWAAGPLRLALGSDGAADPGCAGVAVGRVAVVGARLAPAPEVPAHTRALGSLVDGDPYAAEQVLIDVTAPRARLWRALALIRLGRWKEAAPQLRQALEDPAIDVELQRWLRGDPRGLAPVLRQLLGETAYLELFARTWLRAAEGWSADAVGVLLGETGGLVEQCAGEVCAPLLRARGRALAGLGDAAEAKRTLEAALAAAGTSADGRALASQILVDLTLLEPRGP